MLIAMRARSTPVPDSLTLPVLVLAVMGWTTPVLAQTSLLTAHPTQTVSPEALAQVAQEAVLAAADATTRLVVRARLPRPLEVSAGAVRLQARPFVLPHHPGTTQLVWVQAHVNRRLERSVPVAVEVQAFRAVQVARQSIPPQTPLSPAQFDVQEREISTLPQVPMAVGVNLQGQQARNGLNAGEVLLAAAVQPIPSVRQGQTRWVALTQGVVQVQREVTVAHDAQVGQKVRLRLSNSPLSLEAMVGHGGELEVLER